MDVRRGARLCREPLAGTAPKLQAIRNAAAAGALRKLELGFVRFVTAAAALRKLELGFIRKECMQIERRRRCCPSIGTFRAAAVEDIIGASPGDPRLSHHRPQLA